MKRNAEQVRKAEVKLKAASKQIQLADVKALVFRGRRDRLIRETAEFLSRRTVARLTGLSSARVQQIIDRGEQ
jgi:hypothetical protein